MAAIAANFAAAQTQTPRNDHEMRSMPLNDAVAAVDAASDESKSPPLRDVEYHSIKGYEQYGPGAGPYYPKRAFDENRRGAAVIKCTVAPAGKLSACVLLAEAPTDLSFGAAARRMAETGYMTAIPRPGATAPEEARLVVTFGMAGK